MGEAGALDAVTGVLEYLAPGSAVNRRYVVPGAEVNTGRYERHEVPIRNARMRQHDISLASHGFVLARHRSAVSDFRDRDAVAALYPAEIERLVREQTGADRVVAFGCILRRAGGGGSQGQPPATDVHVDYAPDRAERLARTLLAEAGTPGFRFRRIAAINLWRALSPPPQDWPLALCDGRSVGAEEGVRNAMIRLDALPSPEAMEAELPDDPARPEALVFHVSPAHRWYYFPDMTRDEVLLFTLYESERRGAWRVPHASFADRSRPGAVPRESIEIRTVAYFT